ncbi:MAG: hypothetical protein IPG94_06730 [Kineosporiaceae bacterium]|nr:hypothetical protein [Kineosporiaceae bacterium]
MPECELDGCGISCEFGCACISDLAGCECWCENITLPPLTKLALRQAPDPELFVDFTASQMPLTRLAAVFDDLFPGQILVPAARLDDLVTTDGRMQHVRVGELIESLGLVPRDRPLRGRTPAAESGG